MSASTNRQVVAGFSPTLIFILTFFVFQFAPGLYIYLMDVEENLYGGFIEDYSHASFMYVCSVGIFMIIFIMTRYVGVRGAAFFNKHFNNTTITAKLYNSRFRLLLLPRFFVAFSLLSVLIYFALGGYKKLMLIGSGMDSWEYRLIGYDDRPRSLTAILEISRRVFLPVAIMYYLLLKKIGGRVSIFFILFLFFIQLLAASMTMDRAPFFMLLVLIIYSRFTSIRGVSKMLFLCIISFMSVVLLAGVVTNLQYNITSFSIFDTIAMGLDFVVHRTWLVPSIAPIELSFAKFDFYSDKLCLAYSRLGALVTGNYVGTTEADSIYVTPVGAVGDIWRNWGPLGIISVPVLLGFYFRSLDHMAKNVSVISLVVGNFLIIALCFYWIMGVFFSQGAMFTMAVCFIYFKYEMIIYKKCFRNNYV